MKYLVILGLLVSFAFAMVDINTATKEELVSLKKILKKNKGNITASECKAK